MTGFGGEVPALYHAYRHGYPAAVIDALVDAFELTGQDVVVDLGCGTGQLTLPMAERVSAVVGMDPEPDMLSRARRAGHDAGISNVSWKQGADTDLAGLRGLLGGRPVGAVTVAQALHWMRRDVLFREVAGLVRPGGGIAVVTNGTPLWLQETGWSRALREFLEGWLDTKLTATCGTDEASQRKYRKEIAAAGFEVRAASVDYGVDLDLDQLVGSLFSALGGQLPAPGQRLAFAEEVRRALAPQDRFHEHVHVAVLAGVRRARIATCGIDPEASPMAIQQETRCTDQEPEMP
jgi:SAM-dependent methyltransferase